MNPDQPLFLGLMCLVALLYAAVGHGGASGYLALLAFTDVKSTESAVLALCMNLVASAVSFLAYRRAKHFSWSLTWPFLIGSIPAAYLGGSLRLPGHVHRWVLAVVLLAAAIALIVGPSKKPQADPDSASAGAPDMWTMVAVGAGIGVVSGLVGVGGGIFLSPVLILTGWANAKTTAAVSALFIFANSLSGLAARSATVGPVVSAHLDLVVVGLAGALVGAWIGSQKMSNPQLRRLLGVVLLLAVFKLTL